MSRAVWQISGGPTSRSYAEVFLKQGVALIGPGGGRIMGGRARRRGVRGRFRTAFASEIAVGDACLLRTGSAKIARGGPRGERLPVRERLRRCERLGSPARPARPLVPPSQGARLWERRRRRQPAALLASVERGGPGCGGAAPLPDLPAEEPPLEKVSHVTTHGPEVLDAKWIRPEHLRVVEGGHGAPASERSRMPHATLRDHVMGPGKLLRSNALRASAP